MAKESLIDKIFGAIDNSDFTEILLKRKQEIPQWLQDCDLVLDKEIHAYKNLEILKLKTISTNELLAEYATPHQGLLPNQREDAIMLFLIQFLLEVHKMQMVNHEFSEFLEGDDNVH